MSEIDKLAHYERGLEHSALRSDRLGVRMCHLLYMAEVDIVADAHKVHVMMPQSSTPTNVHTVVQFLTWEWSLCKSLCYAITNMGVCKQPPRITEIRVQCTGLLVVSSFGFCDVACTTYARYTFVVPHCYAACGSWCLAPVDRP